MVTPSVPCAWWVWGITGGVMYLSGGWTEAIMEMGWSTGEGVPKHRWERRGRRLSQEG